jgi:UMF1 family MFS transporter
MKVLLQPGVRRREVWAWAMYDFANSGYTTVVITAVFGAYFVGVVAGDAPWATFAWTLALAVSYGLVMLTAPLVGAWADAHARKKTLLWLTTLGCVGFTAALYFAEPGALALALAALVLSNYFFGSGENIIAAFLPELARPRALGRISGWGWALGYVGGLVSLGVCLAWIDWAQARGQGAAEFVPVTMLLTAAIFLVASLPTLLMLRERATPQSGRAPLNAWRQVRHTLGHLGQLPDLKRFLLCTLVYQAGIQAVITLAAIYASRMLGLFLVLPVFTLYAQEYPDYTPLLAGLAIGAYGLSQALLQIPFGVLSDRLGRKPVITAAGLRAPLARMLLGAPSSFGPESGAPATIGAPSPPRSP